MRKDSYHSPITPRAVFMLSQRAVVYNFLPFTPKLSQLDGSTLQSYSQTHWHHASDSDIIIAGSLSFWGNYFLPIPAGLRVISY